MRRAVFAALAVCALACTPAAAQEPSARLTFVLDGGAGTVRTAKLRCTGEQASATGYLKRAPARHCRRVRKLARFLAAQPDPDRVCTQVYGGPKKARVDGRIGDRIVHRRFDRTDGCAIADWDRMGSLLG